MSTLIPDLVGFTGNRSYIEIPASSLTPNSKTTHNLIADTIVNTLVSVGWTKLSGPTDSTNGNIYELYSAQSPWYDELNIPLWYLGGRLFMRIIHPNSSTISFQFGEYYNGSASGVMTSTIYGLNTNTYAGGLALRILGNPYEMWLWSNQTTSNANGIYAGTLNVPKPIQQGTKVISSLLSTNFTQSDTLLGSVQFSCWRVKDASAITWFDQPGGPSGSSGPQFMSVRGGRPFSTLGNSYARRLWTPTTDSDMDSPEEWNQFILPAQVAYRIESTGTTLTFNGCLWDSMVISESYSRNSVIDMIGREWVCYGGNTSGNEETPCSLWVLVGDS